MEPEGVFSREEYAQAQFWDDRYAEHKGFFDWYVQLPQLQQSLNLYGVEKEHRILVVGCGNSKLSEQLFDAGYSNTVSMDISQVVIQQMRKHCESKGKHIVFQAGDVTAMHYKDRQFDFVLDKGTLDALICGQNLTNSSKMLRECLRVAKQMIIVTYGSPEGRRLVFKDGIGLQDYNYYFIKRQLSDYSMLINLMRANLVDKPLRSILKDKKALLKTVLEYNILQKRLAANKLEVFHIQWENVGKGVKQSEKEAAGEQKQAKGCDIKQKSGDQIQKQKESQTTQVSQQIENKEQITKHEPKQPKDSKQQYNKVAPQPERQGQASLFQQNKEQGGLQQPLGQGQATPPKQQKKVVYKPKKQSFCYIYKVQVK